MPTEHTRYEIFISYARRDNAVPDDAPPGTKGWVTAIKEEIEADFRKFSREPLRVFFDVSEIQDMDDWRLRIQAALRRSSILLVCLSPNYFASRYCRLSASWGSSPNSAFSPPRSSGATR